MYKKLLTCTLALLFFASLFGYAAAKDYEPKSKDEADINDVLVAFQEAASKSDVQKVGPLLHEDFSAEVGRDRTAVN